MSLRSKFSMTLAKCSLECRVIQLSLWPNMAGFMAETIKTHTLHISPEILDIIAELDELKGA